MPQVCIISNVVKASLPNYTERQESTPLIWGGAYDYFSEIGYITVERCSIIISKSGEKLGEYAYFFEWFKKPSVGQVEQLIELIDEALEPIGVKYTITTK